MAGMNTPASATPGGVSPTGMGPAGRPGGGPPSGRPSMRRALEVFQYRHYRILWASSTVSFVGMQMQQVARALLAWQLTGSFAVLGAIALSFGLPMLLFSLIGGSLADRLEKRNLILMTQTSTGLFALLVAVMILTDTITIEWLFVIGLFQGVFFSFGMPARTPLMAEVVGPRNVMSAIAMSNASMNFTRLLGPALAGVLAGVAGLGVVYLVMSSLYVVSVALLLMVPTGLSAIARAEREAMEASGDAPPRFMGQRPRGNMAKEIGAGLRYVWTTPRLRLLIAMMFVITLFAMPHMVLLPGYVQDDLSRSEADVGWLMSIAGIGALIASLAVATLTDFQRKPLVQWTAGVASGIGMLLLAYGPLGMGYAGAILAVVVLGTATTGYQTLNNTMVMGESDPEYYGRVMSINMLTFSVMPLISAPLGILADVIGADHTFAMLGVVILLIMSLIAVTNTRYTFGVEDDHGVSHAQLRESPPHAVQPHASHPHDTQRQAEGVALVPPAVPDATGGGGGG